MERVWSGQVEITFEDILFSLIALSMMMFVVLTALLSYYSHYVTFLK